MTYQIDYDWYKNDNGLIETMLYLRDRYSMSDTDNKYNVSCLESKVDELCAHIYEIRHLNCCVLINKNFKLALDSFEIKEYKEK